MTSKLQVVVYDSEQEGTLEECTISSHMVDFEVGGDEWWEDDDKGLDLLDSMQCNSMQCKFCVTVDIEGDNHTARLLIYERHDVPASRYCEFALDWLKDNYL